MAGGKKPEQGESGRFLPGNNGGNGRPKGSRNKLGEEFLTALQEDFSDHGVAAIQAVRTDKPEVYVKVVASILPKELNVNVNAYDEMSDDELIERIRSLDATIRPFLDAQGEGEDGSGTSAQTTH